MFVFPKVCFSRGLLIVTQVFSLGCSPEGSMFLAFMALTCHDLLRTPRAGGFRFRVALRLLRLGGQQKMPGLHMASSRVLVFLKDLGSCCLQDTSDALDCSIKKQEIFPQFPSISHIHHYSSISPLIPIATAALGDSGSLISKATCTVDQ